VLRGADVAITITSPTSCEVTMTLTVEGTPEIDHRISQANGAEIELLETRGAQMVSDVRQIGRTQSLVLRAGAAAYEIHYRVREPVERADRCPIWLPALATDGRSRVIGIRVRLPPGAMPGHSMPPLDWAGTHGSVRLGHLPAFVRVPYAPDGESPGWSIGQVMDAVAVFFVAAATALWTWRKRR